MRIREVAMATVWMAAAANGAEVGRPLVTVRVFDMAEVPAQTLREASSEAQRIFREAGIETQWLLCLPSTEAPGQDAGCHRTWVASDLSMGIMPKSMEREFRVPDSSFGIAIFSLDGSPTRYAYVFYGRVEETVRKARCSSAALLGHAIAHEVGHLLLGRAHTPRGLMSAKWDKRTLGEIARGLLLFGGDEPQRLQGAAGQTLLSAK